MNSKIKKFFWLAILLLAAGWYGFFQISRPLSIEPYQAGFTGNDFKHIYVGAWMLTHEMDPYDGHELLRQVALRGFASANPYVYLPFTGLVMSPLTLLDPLSALRCWFVLNHALTLGAFVLMFLALGLRPSLRNIAAALSLLALCMPLYRTTASGQLNCVLLFCFSLVFFFEQKRRPVLAGAVAAFAFLFKLAPGILLPYFAYKALCAFATKRDEENQRLYTRSLLSMLLYTALFLGICIAWVGLDQHMKFRPLLEQMGYGKSTWSEPDLGGQHYYCDPANQSFNSLFHHLFVAEGDTTPWRNLGKDFANALTRTAFIVCGLLALWATLPFRRKKGRWEPAPRDNAMIYALFILLALLAPSIYWDHYVVIALWPLFATWTRLPSSVRGNAILLFILLRVPRELQDFIGGSIASLPLIGATALIVFTAIRHRTGSIAPIVWGFAAAMMTMPMYFGHPSLLQSKGLLVMALILWGTLFLFALSLWQVSHPLTETPSTTQKETPNP